MNLDGDNNSEIISITSSISFDDASTESFDFDEILDASDRQADREDNVENRLNLKEWLPD